MAQKYPAPKPEDATWFDHHQLNFWIWACLRDANAYLEASQASEDASNRVFSCDVEAMQSAREQSDLLKSQQDLCAYHFVLTTSNLLRLLTRAIHLFPSIKPAYDKANHFRNEARDLRNMVEHSHGKDGYLVGQGEKQDEYVREDSPQEGIAADATSLIVNDEGHWLGGRLCVEKIVSEVSELQKAAQFLPTPQ